MLETIFTVLGIVLAALYFGIMFGYYLASRIDCEPLRKFYCKLGWHCHSKDYQWDSFDGASAHCTCKWCGYKGMVDSQGNLF